MKRVTFLAGLCFLPFQSRAETAPKIPKRISTTEDFRQLLLATQWSWHSALAGGRDRECVFMQDDTFRHPNFVAHFIITDIHTVELHKKGKGGKAVMTFNDDYTKFEAIDFEKHRITGKRL
jgi:hypothetical protein